MRLLVATSQTEGSRHGDFDHGVIQGEILEPASVCDRDLHNETMPCGCGRAFVGTSSGQHTTTALVADVPIDRDDLHALIRDKHPEAGWWLRRRFVRTLTKYGRTYALGTVVTIERYTLHQRETP